MTSQNTGAAADGPRACPECGTPPIPGQTFCDGCGAVLTWTAPSASGAGGPGPGAGPAGTDAGTEAGADAPGAVVEAMEGSRVVTAGPAAPGATGAPAASTAADAAGGGQAVAASSAVGAPVPAGGRSTDGSSPAPGIPAPAASPEETPTTPQPSPASGAAETEPLPVSAEATAAATERARALLVPVADAQQQETAPDIVPVLPGRPVAARPTVQSPGAELGDDGGAPCPWCGTGNRPDRHFCRRCAMSMEGRPEDPPKLAWWRRLPGFGPRRNPWAGERPRLRGDWSRIIGWLVTAVALALAVTLAVNGGSLAQTVGDHFRKRVLIPPDASKISASHSYAQHGPQLAFDEHSNTWWGPGFTGDDAGHWIQAGFGQPVDLLDVVITPGESADASDLDKAALPQNIEADVTTADGKVRTTVLTLDPNVGPQTRALRFQDVVSVRLAIRSAYNASATKQVAIAEVEFFGPSRGSGS